MGKFICLFLAILLLFALPPRTAVADESAALFEYAERLRSSDLSNDVERARQLHLALVRSGYERSLLPLGEANLILGNTEAALRAFELAANQGKPYAIARLAEAHANKEFGQLSKPEKGLGLLQNLARNTENEKAVMALANYFRDGPAEVRDPKAALELYRSLPNNPWAHIYKGDLMFVGALGAPDPEQAVAAYEKAIDLGFDGAKLELARAYIAAGRYETASRFVDEATAAAPETALRVARWHRDGLLGVLSDRMEAAEIVRNGHNAGTFDLLTVQGIWRSLAKQMMADGQVQQAVTVNDWNRATGSQEATLQLVRWHRDNALGAKSDPYEALMLFNKLADDGYVEGDTLFSMRLSLARALQRLDQHESAKDALQAGVEAGDPQTIVQLAGWHRDLALGELSDPSRGAELLSGALARIGETTTETQIELADLLLDSGLEEHAMTALKPALEQNEPAAQLALTFWRIEERLGTAEERSSSFREMSRYLEEGNVDAAIFASFRLEQATKPSTERTISILDGAMRDGNREATRALARAYRTYEDSIPNANAKHRKLLETFGHQIEEQYRPAEEVYAQFVSHGRRLNATDVVSPLQGEAFVRAMLELRSLDRNAYVRALQHELRALGQGHVPRDGVLSRGTLRAILSFCHANGIGTLCREKGPIEKNTSMAIVEALAAQRAQALPAAGKRMVFEGDQGFKPVRLKRLPQDTVIDLSNATFRVSISQNPAPVANRDCKVGTSPVNRYPFAIENSAGIKIEKGVFEGTVPLKSDWLYTYCNSAAVRVEASPNASVEGARFTQVWDGIRIADGTSNFTIAGVQMSDVRDDCIENDWLMAGVIRDSLLDGCFAGISVAPIKRLSRKADLRIENVIMRMTSFTYRGRLNHALPIKIESNGARIELNDSVFAVESQKPVGSSNVSTMWQAIGKCRNNRLLWLGKGPVPDWVKAAPKCFQIHAGADAQRIWETRKQQWTNRQAAG